MQLRQFSTHILIGLKFKYVGLWIMGYEFEFA